MDLYKDARNKGTGSANGLKKKQPRLFGQKTIKTTKDNFFAFVYNSFNSIVLYELHFFLYI